jgi:phosphoserine aminotransferase
MKRVFNFSPGPAMLPEPVLLRAQAELLDWRGSGMSVMEVSHRGSDFIEFAAQSERTLRELLGVPPSYKVLFLQGGATLQFAAVPLNIAPVGSVADYVVTGNWGEKAVQEAQRYVSVNVAANSKSSKFTTVPDPRSWQVSSAAAYLHYTPNETISGVEFHSVPEVSDAPLVADMSSTLLSRPVDVSRFGIIYAGAQKNIGPAGLALVIVREDLLGRARSTTRRWPTTIRCGTPPRRCRGISPGSCSTGSRNRAAWPPWARSTSVRLRSSTRRSTGRGSTRILSTRHIARG